MKSKEGRRMPGQGIDLNDIIGRRFGRLVVTARADDVRDAADQVQRRYLCRCDCGFENAVVYRGSLLKGQTRSCGCLRREKSRECGMTAAQKRGFNPSDVIGQRFGSLTVVELAERRRQPWQTQWYYYYRCRCDCGGERIVGRGVLLGGGATSCRYGCNKEI